jgi:hypothetical protein
MLLCGHAMLLGAVEASCKLLETGKPEVWTSDFRASSMEAAATASPVGGYIMREHLLKEGETE